MNLTQLENLPILQWTLWALAIIVGALIASFLVPPLVGILRDMRDTLSRMRRMVAAWAREIGVPLWDNFWLRRERDPREPVLAGLNRVNLAARNLCVDSARSSKSCCVVESPNADSCSTRALFVGRGAIT